MFRCHEKSKSRLSVTQSIWHKPKASELGGCCILCDLEKKGMLAHLKCEEPLSLKLFAKINKGEKN